LQREKDLIGQAADRQAAQDRQIRSDVEQLVVTTDQHATISKIAFLIDDLTDLVPRQSPSEKMVTGLLVEFFKSDADFDSPAAAKSDIVTMDKWKPYQQYLMTNLSYQQLILYKYFEGLRHLHDKNKNYIESIEYDQSSGYVVKHFADDGSVLAHVSALVDGFARHLDFIKQMPTAAAQSQIQQQLSEFEQATGTKDVDGRNVWVAARLRHAAHRWYGALS
jgi:hypothetical protein